MPSAFSALLIGGPQGVVGLQGATGVNSGPPGATGLVGATGVAVGNNYVSMTAGQNINARDLVYIAVSGSNGQTAGRVYQASASHIYSSTTAWLLGFATAAATTGNSVNVQVASILGGFTGLTTGAVYHPATTAGQITTTILPNCMVAIAINSTTIEINRVAGQSAYNTPISAPIAVNGYFAGGYTGSGVAVNTADRIVFSSGVTSANTISNLSTARGAGVGSISDGTLYGYFGGGYTTADVVNTDRITFSTGAVAANTVSNISSPRRGGDGVSDTVNYGYFSGGFHDPSFFLDTTDRITFSSGVTSAATVSNLSLARDGIAAVGDRVNYGYFCGGGTTSNVVATSDRIVFSSGITSANTVSNISQARYFLVGVSDGTNYGYVAGGGTASPGLVVTADRIIYSTGVTSVNTVSNLSQARNDMAGTSDGINYGYFAGGYTNNAVATTDRIIFSTGVTTLNTVSDLTQARWTPFGINDSAV